MRIARALVLLALAAAPPAVRAEELAGASDGPTVRYVDFETPVHPISALTIERSIDAAEEAGDAFVLLRLDTPGGLTTSMEAIVKRVLAAKVPVVAWVGPSGAKAASAGFFVLISADVAAMAHGTRTGAASTVYAGGESRDDDVLLRKMNEDAAALIRSIADRRGRNVEACERAVFAAKAYEERVALEEGLIDLVVDSREDLMARLDGREVRRFDGSTIVLRTAGARFVTTTFDLRHRFMEFLAIPAVAAFLFLVGVFGLWVELSHPGMVFPGVVGALCLLLFALSAQTLPVNAVGALLIVLALVMFLLEIKVASYGMLTVGGVVALAIGAFMLIDGPIPELRVPPVFLAPVVVTLVTLALIVMRLALGAHRGRIETGREGLVGEVGTAETFLSPTGTIFVHGELWNAVSVGGPVAQGARVRVIEIDGMTLRVEDAAAPRREGS